MHMIGGWEVLVVLLLILLLFGGKRLPELARNLGKGVREFKQASSSLTEEVEKAKPEIKSDPE